MRGRKRFPISLRGSGVLEVTNFQAVSGLLLTAKPQTKLEERKKRIKQDKMENKWASLSY